MLSMPFGRFVLLIVSITALSTKLMGEISLQPSTDNEARFVRRIIEFRQEKEETLFLHEVFSFLKKYPQSPLCSDLHALLGDHYVETKNFKEAEKYYEKITDDQGQSPIIINYLQALFHLKKYEKMQQLAQKHLQEIPPSNPKKHIRIRFLYAESIYRSLIEKNLDITQAKQTIQTAIDLYEDLLKTDLSIDAMRSLGHLYYFMHQYQQSSRIYQILAEKDEENREKYLFQTAMIEAKFDKEKAEKTFEKISHTGQKYKEKAAYNRMILLHECEKYAELILAKEQLEKVLTSDKHPLLYFFLGKAHLERDDLERSETFFRKFLASDSYKGEKKPAILALAQIGVKKEDLPLLEEMLAISSPENVDEYSKVLFATAMVYKQKQMYEKSENLLQKTVSLTQNTGKNSYIYFEYAHTLFLNKKWKTSRNCFAKFLRENPQGEKSPLAWKYFLHSSYNLSKDPQSHFSDKMLCEDLSQALCQKEFKNTEEGQSYQFLLAKTHYENSEYKKSLEILQPILKKPLSNFVHAQSLVLYGFCLKNTEKSPEKYIVYFEKALQVAPNMEGRQKIHLALFNSYISMNKDKAQYSDDAAKNLYLAFSLKEKIQKKNIFWLSHYYLKEKTDLKKAITLLQGITSENLFSLSFGEKEKHLVQLFHAYKQAKEENLAIALFDKLEAEYTKSPKKAWKFKNYVYFELAKEYEKRKLTTKALNYYDKIYKNSISYREFMQAKACLQGCRLRMHLLHAQEIVPENPEVISILQHLKDLSIYKTLENEPVHLEAALEYIDLACKMNPQVNKEQKRIQLLRSMLHSFTSCETIWDKEYHDKLAKDPKKNTIYQNYIDLIKNEIQMHEKKMPQPEIRAKLQKLLNLADITEYLKKRVEKHLENFVIDEKK